MLRFFTSLGETRLRYSSAAGGLSHFLGCEADRMDLCLDPSRRSRLFPTGVKHDAWSGKKPLDFAPSSPQRSMLFQHRNGFGFGFLLLFFVLSEGLVNCAALPAQAPPELQQVAAESDPAALAQVAYETTGGVKPVGFQDAPDAPADKPAVTKEMIAQEQAMVESTQDIPEDAKAKIKENLKKASDWIDAEAALKKRRADIEAQLPAIPEELAKTRKNLDQFSDAEFQALPIGTSIAELEGQVASLRQQVEADNALLRTREKEIEGRTERLSALAKEAIDLEQRIADLTKQTSMPEPATTEGRAQHMEIRARLNARIQELGVAKLERRRLEGIAELLPLQRDLAKRVSSNRQSMLARWQTMIDAKRKEESRYQAEIARRKVARSHPALKSLAEQNALIAEQRMKTAAEIQRATDLIKSLSEQSTADRGRFRGSP